MGNITIFSLIAAALIAFYMLLNTSDKFEVLACIFVMILTISTLIVNFIL